jgi:hypothetical protein
MCSIPTDLAIVLLPGGRRGEGQSGRAASRTKSLWNKWRCRHSSNIDIKDRRGYPATPSRAQQGGRWWGDKDKRESETAATAQTLTSRIHTHPSHPVQFTRIDVPLHTFRNAALIAKILRQYCIITISLTIHMLQTNSRSDDNRCDDNGNPEGRR